MNIEERTIDTLARDAADVPRREEAAEPGASLRGVRALYLSYDGLLEPLGQSQILPYVRGLARCGAVIRLLTFEKPEAWRSGRDAMAALRRGLEAEGIGWTALRYHRSPTVPATAYDLLRGVLVGVWVALRCSVHLVHARSEVAGIMAWVVSRLTGARFLFDMRGFWADERVEAGLWPAEGWLYRAAKRWEGRLLRDAQAVVTLTEAARCEVERDAAARPRRAKVAVIPTCTDLDRFQPAPKSTRLLQALRLEEQWLLLYSGALGTWYLLEEMARFFQAIRRRQPNAHFLALTSQDSRVVQTAWARCGMDETTITVRTVPFAEMPEWLSLADASVLFRRPGASLAGVCPTKIGESLACGVPVVINAGIGDCDVMVRARRVGVVMPQLLGEAYDAAAVDVIALSREPDVRARCRAAAEALFGLERGVAGYAAVYRRLEAGRGTDA